MNKYIAAGIVVGAIFAGALIKSDWKPKNPAPSKTTVEWAQESTVRIKAPDGAGSGFVISRREVANHEVRYFVWTARHVTQPNFSDLKVEKVIRWGATNRVTYTYVAHTLVRLPNNDAALLALEAPPGAFYGVDVYTSEIAVGDPLFIIGSPLTDFDGSVTTGVLSQRDSHPEDTSDGWPWRLVDQTDARVLPGSSGGPVFARNGAVIGIAVGGPNRGTLGIAHFVPIRAIRSDVSAANIDWALAGRYCPEDSVVAVAVREQAKTDELLKASAKKAAEENQPKAEPVKPSTSRMVSPHWQNRGH